MHSLLSQIFDSKQFINSKGETVEVHSETSRRQCEFLQDIIQKHSYKHSIEIGLAYGVSSLAIIESVVKNGGSHFAIDKFQSTVWGNNGMELISMAGYSDKMEFSPEYSYQTLPKLLEAGRKFDIAYIDSTKQFDWLLVDFFYLDRLLNINGMIVFDDVTWPGIRKLLRLLSQFPSYKVYGSLPENAPAVQTSKWARFLLKYAKTRRFLKSELLKTDFELGVNSHCVALHKIDDDKRNWDWHIDF